MLVFDQRGKPEYPGENFSWQSREPTNSIHIWHRVRKSNPGHIGGRQVLSPLGQPFHHECGVDTEDKRYNIVGCEDVPHFGPAVANGKKVKVDDTTPWIVRKAVHALLKYPQSRAFLLECTELPPYSDAIRFYKGFTSLWFYHSMSFLHQWTQGQLEVWPSRLARCMGWKGRRVLLWR